MEIKELIEDLRRQLEALDRDRQDADLPALFSLGSVEVEISFVVKESADGKAGFDVKIVSANMGGGHSQESIQKMKISLIPAGVSSEGGVLGTRFHDKAIKTNFEPFEQDVS